MTQTILISLYEFVASDISCQKRNFYQKRYISENVEFTNLINFDSQLHKLY